MKSEFLNVPSKDAGFLVQVWHHSVCVNWPLYNPFSLFYINSKNLVQVSQQKKFPVRIIISLKIVYIFLISGHFGFCAVCNTNCHHKCQKFMPNLCGVNQKMLAEALRQVRISSSDRRRPTLPGTSPTVSLQLCSLVACIWYFFEVFGATCVWEINWERVRMCQLVHAYVYMRG